MVDLHVHSTRSDGTLTPSELVDYAIEKGLSAFALTDHDTVEGIDEAVSYAESLREKGISAPKVIPGIEFSTEHEGRDIHVVGLFIDKNSDAFSKYLQDFIDSREKRNLEMCKKLTDGGLPISYSELMAEFPGAVITRAHVAKLMLKKGFVKSLPEAFERYIGDNAKYAVPREKVTPEMAIDLILKAGGIPVLAHPILYHMSKQKLDDYVGELKEHGLMGIEAIYSTYTPSDERQIRELAKKYQLLLSGGSDFHGSNKKDIDLGVGYGKLYLGDEILKDIEKAHKKILFSDMDGTLLLSDSTISENMKKAIDGLFKRGHQFVLTSGRPLPSMLERKVNFGFNYPDMWIISNNGALIYDCKKEEVIYSRKLSQDVLRQVITMADNAGIHVHAYTESEIVCREENREIEFYTRRIKMPIIKTDDMASYLKDGTFKAQIIALEDVDRLFKLKDEILNVLGDKVEAFFSNNYYLEVLPKGVSKGAAIEYLSSLLDIKKENTFAAGDSDNDIPMLLAARNSVAVSNATENVKKVATIITKNDNNNDGLIEVIEEYFK